MFQRLTNFGTRHPSLATGVFVTLVITLLVYTGALVVLDAVVESQRKACEIGNDGRLSALRDATAEIRLATSEVTEAESQDRPTFALREFIAEQQGRVKGLKEAVIPNGTTEDAVTVECEKVNPNPLRLVG